MARLKRLYFPGVSQHIIQRGNDRQACFYDEADYTVYLDKLKGASKKYNVAVHAYVLMTNHVHILATPSDEMGISRMMRSLGRYYVRYVNQTYSRTGTLWLDYLRLISYWTRQRLVFSVFRCIIQFTDAVPVMGWVVFLPNGNQVRVRTMPGLSPQL